MDQPSLAVVVNPRTLVGACGPLADRALAALRAGGVVSVLETAGDAGDAALIDALIGAERPHALVAAGGDGTVRAAAAALLRVEPPARPALAILPLGTGNNIARALGLTAFRTGGAAAVDRAAAIIRAARSVPLDAGEADGSCFIGSFAVGMDGAILASRNRWQQRFGLGRAIGGYPLYLMSCAVNLARQRAVAARLSVDGAAETASIHDLVVTNTALYAGEFRFDAGDHSDDGRLDLHVFHSPADYVRCFVAAWRRHVRRQRGEAVEALPRLRRVERVDVELAAPLASQLDGEEGQCGTRFGVRVLPRALQVYR